MLPPPCYVLTLGSYYFHYRHLLQAAAGDLHWVPAMYATVCVFLAHVARLLEVLPLATLTVTPGPVGPFKLVRHVVGALAPTNPLLIVFS